MATCLGLDLTARDWLLSEARSSEDGTSLATRSCEAISPAELPADGLFPLLDEPLVEVLNDIIGRDSKTSALDDDKRLLMHVKRFAGHERGHGNPKLWALVHPYRTSPPVRRVLPVLLGAAEINRYNDAGGRNHVAIEAPLAAAVQLAAEKPLALPANLLILHGTPALAELTAVRLSADGSELQLAVRAFCELNGPEAPWDEPLRGFAERLAKEPAEGAWQLRCIGGHLEPQAQSVARALGIAASDVFIEPADCAALGAARYALQRLERNLHGTMFDKLQIQRVTPRAIGLCGVNRHGDQGEHCWHRLFPAGTSLPAHATVRLELKKAPTLLVLCESPAGEVGKAAWLTNRMWEQHRRQIYTFWAAGQPLKLTGPQVHLRIGLNPPAADSRWNDPRIKLKYEALPAT